MKNMVPERVIKHAIATAEKDSEMNLERLKSGIPVPGKAPLNLSWCPSGVILLMV